MPGRERYTSRVHAGARFVAQRGLLRPVVWAITDVQVHGRENLDNFSGPYVVVSNHSSHLDTPLIMGALPRRLSRYLSAGAAADYWFRNAWRRTFTVLMFNAFPVDRGGTRNRKGLAGKLLSDGVPLLLYPEGTRSRTGQMARFKPGAAALCISRNVPCIPIALVGAHEAMPSGNGWVHRGRPPVHVVIGSPMWARPGEAAARFSERISKVIRDMHDQTALTMGLPRLIEHASRAAEQEAREALLARGDDESLDVAEEQAQNALVADEAGARAEELAEEEREDREEELPAPTPLGPRRPPAPRRAPAPVRVLRRAGSTVLRTLPVVGRRARGRHQDTDGAHQRPTNDEDHTSAREETA